MKLALIQILGEHEGVDPGYGRPGGGFGGPVDPGYGRPIFHPGHPDHGLPSHGHPDNSLPWAPGHPDNNLPLPPGIDRPETPPSLKNKLIVLWRLPNTVEWHGKAMDPSNRPDHDLPPTAAPKY